MIIENQMQFAIVFPEDAVAERGFGVKVYYLHNPQNLIEQQMVEGVLQRTLFSQTPRIYLEELQSSMEGLFTESEIDQFNEGIANTVAETFGMAKEDALAFIGENNPMDGLVLDPSGEAVAETMSEQFEELATRLVDIREEQLVGQEVTNPVGTRMIGGWAIMFLLFSLTGAASSLFDEKHAGIFYRLLSGPIRKEDILLSKFMLMVLIGLSQLIICFLAGWFFFRIEIFSLFLSLAIYSFIVALSCTSFGMLLGSISKTSSQANGYATLFILPMSALGGAWWPISLMPDWIQVFSVVTLVYWAIEGYEQILWAQRGLAGAALQMLILLGFTALALGFSTWRFRTGDLFR
jgi:ABC-2 type transport system permease protein